MKKIHYKIVLSIIIISSMFFQFNVYANEDDDRIKFDEHNISISTTYPGNWFHVTQDKMDSQDLVVMKKSKDTMKVFLFDNNMIYYAVNNNRTAEICVSVKSTQLTQNIYNLDKANFNKVTDYINSLESIHVLPSQTEVINTTDRYLHNKVNFVIVEYTYSKEKKNGICYTTVVNGKSISIDCRYQNSNIEQILKNDLKNFVSEIEFEILANPNKLSSEQLIIAGGGIFIGVLFLILLIIGGKRKKNSY